MKTACAGSARSVATSVRLSSASAEVSGTIVTLSRFGPKAVVLASRMVFAPLASVTVTLWSCQVSHRPVLANCGAAVCSAVHRQAHRPRGAAAVGVAEGEGIGSSARRVHGELHRVVLVTHIHVAGAGEAGLSTATCVFAVPGRRH